MFNRIQGKIYTDSTGQFPIPSARGNNYILVCYAYDYNAILVEAYRNRTKECLTAAYERIYARLTARGATPRVHILDNECPQLLKDFMASKGGAWQLVPPHIHRRNAAECAVRTFKNHFVAGLATTDAQFPMKLWDELLPQAELSLNLLRGLRLNPDISAWNHLMKIYDFEAHPIGPPGCQVLVFETPKQRKTWANHGLKGWYVAPAWEMHRAFKVYIDTTFQLPSMRNISMVPQNHRNAHCDIRESIGGVYP